MEELTKRNGRGLWMREIEKTLKRFDASLEWLLERIGLMDKEIDKTRKDGQLEEGAKKELLKARKLKNIDEVLEEVEVLIDTHFFNEFSKTNPHRF